MSQKLALESMQLVREASSKDGVRKKKQKLSLIDKEKAKFYVDNTETNIKNLTKKDYRKLSKYKTELLGRLSDFNSDYIALEKKKKAKQREEEQKSAELDKDLDEFIADFFKDSSTSEPYKSEKVKQREKRKEMNERCSVSRFTGCG